MTVTHRGGMRDHGVEDANRNSADRSDGRSTAEFARPVETGQGLAGEVNPRVVLAVLWLGHFLLWTFGDMFSLLQGLGEPITETVFLVVAPTTAIVQASMAALSLLGTVTLVRRATFIVAPLYLLMNVGFIAEASHGWQYYLGVAYIGFNLLIIRFASKRLAAS